MKIWTTRDFAGIFFQDGKFPLEIAPPGDIAAAFLRSAIPGDMAVMELPGEYIEFLAAAKAKGVPGPFIFILPEPVIIDEQLKQYNAMVLDLEKTEISEIREVAGFIARLALDHDMRLAAEQCAAGEVSIAEFKTLRKDDPVKDTLRIRQVLEYVLRGEGPAIVSVRILEDGEPVTARGVCHIDSFNDQELVLNRFKPLVFSLAVREKTQVRLVLTHRGDNYEFVSTVLRAGRDLLHVAMPDTLFNEKRTSIRIEPSRKNPVLLYILRKNRPTASFRVIDIGLCGLCFEAGVEFAAGEAYGFAIVLPRSGIVLSYGKILYQRPVASVYRYGVQLNVHPSDEDRIANYLMAREKEISTLMGRLG